MLRLICGYAQKSERSLEEKLSIYDELKGEWDKHSVGDLVMSLGNHSGHVGRYIDGFDGVHGENCIGQKKLEGRILLEICLEKKLCVSNAWFKREEKRKVTFRMGENETEIDFVLIKEEYCHFIQNVTVISVEFQHALVIADIDKRKIRKVVRKTCAERRKITLLKDVKIRKRFEEELTELVNVVAPNLWEHFKDEVLKACDEVCGKRGRRSKGDIWC